MNPLTTTPPELVLALLRAEAVERMPSLRRRAPRSVRRAIGRTMVTWGARLAPPDELTARPARFASVNGA